MTTKTIWYLVPTAKYLAENHKITFCFCSRHAENKKLRNEFSILVLIFFLWGGFFISAVFYLVLMFVLFYRAPAVVPAAPPPPPPAQGGQGPGFYSAAQKYTESEEKPSSSQLQSRSFKFLQGMMDSGQGKFILPNQKNDKEPRNTLVH